MFAISAISIIDFLETFLPWYSIKSSLSPVKISTGRLIGTTKPTYRTSYALVRYIASRPFTKTVSSSIDTKSNESILKNIFERIKEFFYS